MKLEKIQKRFFDVDKSIHLVLFNIITLAGIGGGILGLIVSVACKLPLVQLASIAAALLDMRFRYALPSIVGGVMMAGLIMCFGTSAVQWIINLF